MHKVEDLKIWKKSIELRKSVYKIISELSAEEKFGLIPQLRRSAISVPTNIAEGAARWSKNEFRHFLSFANGSVYELHTQLILIIELNLIKKDKISPIFEQCVEIQKMNYALQQKLL